MPLRTSFSLQLCLNFFVHYVAIVSQPFSQRLTSHTSLGLTLLPICPVCCCVTATESHPVGFMQIRKLPSRAGSTSRPSFMPSLSTPSGSSLPVSFAAVSVPPPGFPSVTICQPTCRDCTLHVPRRLWKVADSNRLLILSSSGNHRRFGRTPYH